MLAVSSNPNWLQLFLGGSIGVLLTFILARGLDTVRNRPYLEVRLQETQERLYVRNDGMGARLALSSAIQAILTRSLSSHWTSCALIIATNAMASSQLSFHSRTCKTGSPSSTRR